MVLEEATPTSSKTEKKKKETKEKKKEKQGKEEKKQKKAKEVREAEEAKETRKEGKKEKRKRGDSGEALSDRDRDVRNPVIGGEIENDAGPNRKKTKTDAGDEQFPDDPYMRNEEEDRENNLEDAAAGSENGHTARTGKKEKEKKMENIMPGWMANGVDCTVQFFKRQRDYTQIMRTDDRTHVRGL